MPQISRGKFKNKFGFIAATAGSAVGLGNIWKFPFEVGNGGGAIFIVVYLFFCFAFCFPVMLGEIAIGRKTQKSPVGAYGALGYPKWKFLGALGVISGVLILSFYNVVAGWALGYFVEMVQGNFGIAKEFTQYIANPLPILGYSFLFMSMTAFVVSQGITAGIEKFSKILMPLLVFFIIALMVYGLTLPGAEEGLEFYLFPNFSKLTLQVIYSAMGQAFFSLSLGLGAAITYGSYLSKRENLISSAFYITIADVGIAFLAGLMLFPIIFSQGQTPDGGPGLIFVTLPTIFATFGDVLGILLGASFFFLLTLAALTSTFSLLEVGSSYLIDQFKVPRKTSTWVSAVFIFLLGLPSLYASGASDFFTEFIHYGSSEKAIDFLTFVGHVSNDTFLPLGGFLMCIFITFVWGRKRLRKELCEGNSEFETSWLAAYINFSIAILCPIVLGTILILTIFDRFLGIDLLSLLLT